MLKQSAPYSFVNRFKKVISPKSFDRVYSIFINENDFVLDVDPGNVFSMDTNPLLAGDDSITLTNLKEAYQNIFEQPPNINVTSKIERPANMNFNPAQVLNITGNENYADAILDIANYAWSAEENVPGVFQYKAQVSLLPLNFQLDGNAATLLGPSDAVQAEVAVDSAVRPSAEALDGLSQLNAAGNSTFKIPGVN
jgi:hypothetical protein